MYLQLWHYKTWAIVLYLKAFAFLGNALFCPQYGISLVEKSHPAPHLVREV